MNPLLRRAWLAGQVTRALGPDWVAVRAGHALRLRSGAIRRRLPAVAWAAVPLAAALVDPALAEPAAYLAYRQERAPVFFFRPQDRSGGAPLLRAWDAAEDGVGWGPVAAADALAAGTIRAFGSTLVRIGDPPAWHRNPFTGQEAPADRHWSEISDFACGDIKAIWEASRFAVTYDLVRAYWRTGDDAHAERFWRLVESWRAANPPQRGPNWKCGQETSLRVMAWCFGLYGFLDAPATTPERVTVLAQMIAVSGRRVEATLDYALNQRNNHGVSEGMGLWTIGALFPELRAATRWRTCGRAILERLGHALIDGDGVFSQYSFNYQRLMLHDYVWALRLGELRGEPFGRALYDRIGRAADLLYGVQDDSTGEVPGYGANDGALILPLSTSDVRDYRPVIQAARYLVTRTRTYGDGPWDEALCWLFGTAATRAPVAPPPRTDLRAVASGYYVLRAATGFAFTRCGPFRHRPSHADLLHVDLWWRGVNVALDPGTYSYNAPAPWDNALAHTAAHNTVTVDGRDQMDLVSRFLWYPWARGRRRVDVASPGDHLAYWEGEHDGYRRLPDPVTHRRAIVRIGDGHWLVLDELRGRRPHAARLHWLLPDLPYRFAGELARPPVDAGEAVLVRERVAGGEVTLATAAGPYAVSLGSLTGPGRLSLVRAAAEAARGWRSSAYLDRAPALSLAFELAAGSPTARLWTLLGSAGCAVTATDGDIRVLGNGWQADLTLGTAAGQPLATAVRLRGAMTDELEVVFQ